MYKFKVYQCPNWRNYDTLILPISVGNEKFEGQKVVEYIHWAHLNFKKVIIKISDVNKCYNLIWMKGIELSSAYEIAKNNADKWLIEYGTVLSQYDNVSIVRLCDYRNRVDFKEIVDSYLVSCEHDPKFRELLLTDANRFLRKRESKNSRIEDIEKYCILYRIEEIAFDDIICKHERMAYAYFGNELSCKKYIRKEANKTLHQGMENTYHINVKAKRRKAIDCEVLE